MMDLESIIDTSYAEWILIDLVELGDYMAPTSTFIFIFMREADGLKF